MKTAFRCNVALVVLAVAGVAQAQNNSQSSLPSTIEPTDTPGYSGGYGGGYGYFSSTVEEGLGRGVAEVTRAAGEANLNHSLAAVNYQAALGRAIINREEAIASYLRTQELNREFRAAQAKPLSAEQYVSLARKQGPGRLNDFEYDRFLGRLQWPASLLDEQFAAERAVLDKAFAHRKTSDTGLGSPFHRQVDQVTSQMRSKLQANMDNMSPMEFVAARKFLTSLNYESHQPLFAEALASK